jgi:uncharacterized protein YydD (DUF2326 family)
VKISKLYCNENSIFNPIEFNEGLNVIYAKVTRPKDTTKDSHNLGKTLLIHLIDFLLLKEFGRGHFLYDNKSIFDKYTFFLELRTNKGSYITIRREVAKNSKICLQTHNEVHQDYSQVLPEQWEHAELPLGKAKDVLNSLLDLSDIFPWEYRKGCGYFLRTQNDYQDVFQLSRFAIGKHSEWKPFMAKLLGFDHTPIEKKYEIDEQILGKQQLRESSKDIVDTEDYDRIKGTLEIKRTEVLQAQQEIEKFNFYKEDMRYNTELVEKVEDEISELNERLYTIDYELNKLREALKVNVKFDLEKVQSVFKEAHIIFPESLRKSYEQLVDFNRRLSTDRGARLAERVEELSEEHAGIARKLQQLNQRRSDILSVVQDTDSLRKFRKLQKTLVSRETEIARLETILEHLDKVTSIDKNIRELSKERDGHVEATETMIRKGNPLYQTVRDKFNNIIKAILNLPAVISINTNKEGNIEFQANILKSESSSITTSEDKGTSYRRLLCCAFDISLLYAHRKGSFYRFVYHDGVFEGLDNRKKVLLLKVVRELCEQERMQYILTVIDSDIPRDIFDKPIPFAQNEIMLNLFEGEDKGRLFRMPKF